VRPCSQSWREARPTGPARSGHRVCFAQFFGGQANSSPYARMWQWSGGGGATNGIGGFNGDLDTIDAIRLP